MRFDQDTRGQTAFDFVIGFSIFIMAVMFTFMMTPSLLTPFTESQAAQPLLADRVADDLSESKLVDSPTSSELNTTEADSFFNQSDEELNAYLGAGNLTRINVSVVNTETGEIANGSEYRVGPAYPEDRGRMTVTQRIVLLDGESHWLYVRVW